MPAGILVHSFDLKEISYAPVIAAAMLRRQQVRCCRNRPVGSWERLNQAIHTSTLNHNTVQSKADAMRSCGDLHIPQLKTATLFQPKVL